MADPVTLDLASMHVTGDYFNAEKRDFVRSRFESCLLDRISFWGANLGTTNFAYSTFYACDFSDADLSRCRNLELTELRYCHFNERTKWPEDFDPAWVMAA